jgi:hypothetical protein
MPHIFMLVLEKKTNDLVGSTHRGRGLAGMTRLIKASTTEKGWTNKALLQ